MSTEKEKNRSTLLAFLFSVVLTCSLLAVFVFTGCNVTRRVTTESSYYQKGDTSCTITVKTVESYDASKKVVN